MAQEPARGAIAQAAITILVHEWDLTETLTSVTLLADRDRALAHVLFVVSALKAWAMSARLPPVPEYFKGASLHHNS